MKKNILLVFLYLITVLLFSSCKNQSEKQDIQKNKVEEKELSSVEIPYGDALSTGEIAEPINCLLYTSDAADD